jgi:NAD(P)-dependent dehydrogenase (short-subunit alcohol dehydrogenase family)
MGRIDSTGLLRQGLLETCSVLVACPSTPAEGLGGAVAEGCAALGARVSGCEPDAVAEQPVDDAVAAALAEVGEIDALIVDGADLFASAPSAQLALRACLDATWNVTRAVMKLAFLPAERGGRIVLLAPRTDRLSPPERAEAARAGLENLARTLSVEWARHGVTAVTIAPGEGTAAGEVAALCAYLVSPAGAYFSGCLLDLRGP